MADDGLQPAGEGLRQLVYETIGGYRSGQQAAGLRINGNLEAMAQYLSDRKQSGEATGVIPTETRSPLDLAKLFWYTGEAVDLVMVTPWDSASQQLIQTWDRNAQFKAVVAGPYQEMGVGVGGGPMNLWAVCAFGKRANMAAEPRTAARRVVHLNERFDCVGPALANEDAPAIESDL